MTRQTTPGRYSVQVGKVWLIAGLYWQYLPLRGRRSMRLRARAAKASHWAALPTEEGQAQGTLLGTVNINDITGHKRGRLQQASMALAVLPTLPADCYAVFLLPNGQYWFVAINNGMLSPFGDIVGSETAVRTAVDNFLQITAVPDGGWTVYAPAGFFPDTAIQARELIPQLSNTSGLRRARLYKTHDTQAMWFWGGAMVALLGGYFGYSIWQTHLNDQRIAVAQAALLEKQNVRQQAPADSLKPWGKQPLFSEMLSGCSTVWKSAQISIAGWVFNTADCTVNGRMVLHYTLPNGGTVGDFAVHLPVLYGQDIQPEFNIPGSANDASFILPVTLVKPDRPEDLLPGDQQIQHLTSYAQRINARLRLSAVDTSTQLTQGEAQSLPWRTYSFAFITDIPPDRLFAPTRFNSSGIRASSIVTTLKNNRLEYTIEGVLYAER